ncbi:hypothetical protein OA58_02100 [Microcystis aeruginosa NIES-88]|nr:hypothetical protein OA58_02100 [Microcystis aeruginosa NIES-88]BCU12509.1 hypothetical protein MAN88_30730 [Microcystis aeruginosa]
MTRESQKLYELNVVKLFRDAGGLSHYAELHVPDHLERPDIIARIDSITIGIEISAIAIL